MDEKILGSTRVYDGKLVKVDKLTVQLPDNATALREVVQHPGAVAIVPIDAENNVLLVRQFRIAANKSLLEIPAGTLEPGEQPDLAAVREMREETGYHPGQIQPIGGIYAAPGYTTEYIHLYYATDLTESPLDQDEDEFIELIRMPYAESLRLIEKGDIEDSKTVAGLLRVAHILGR
ncbi:NUDIX hydrolase [Phototrophicus methaneseepsis]|uniref:NUDIX hydrolase n=1 Tax=Phototrophicus methaneseepsis TaxID=2710758 RepID=A0A7S8E777_9CHLR|nr:NUDIX hydrolase [Phototrophicus methaneseepsis]QPC81637.1 NUDIX hydrolase [Phototrophicus methaneseepsis]